MSSLELLAWAGIAAASGFSLFRLASKVPFPALWVWLISAGMVFLYALLAVLYETGGRFVVLLPVFFPLKVAVQTTGALALAVACYASVEGADKISAQWFAIPTGSAPLSMLYQYVAPLYIQAAFVGIALAYCASKGSQFVLPLGAVMAAVAADYLGLAVPGVLDGYQLYFALHAAALLLCSILATGGKIKTK